MAVEKSIFIASDEICPAKLFTVVCGQLTPRPCYALTLTCLEQILLASFKDTQTTASLAHSPVVIRQLMNQWAALLFAACLHLFTGSSGILVYLISDPRHLAVGNSA